MCVLPCAGVIALIGARNIPALSWEQHRRTSSVCAWVLKWGCFQGKMRSWDIVFSIDDDPTKTLKCPVFGLWLIQLSYSLLELKLMSPSSPVLFSVRMKEIRTLRSTELGENSGLWATFLKTCTIQTREGMVIQNLLWCNPAILGHSG